jgi:UDP-glucose 4-epimerase
MNIIITGSEGYIGSVLFAKLVNMGHTVHGIDLRAEISNDYEYIRRLIKSVDHHIDAIVHLGANSLLGPSVENPLEYYNNNVIKNINMLNDLVNLKWKGKFIFASSAAVYGEPEFNYPVPEIASTIPINPYGNTKLMMETILIDSFISYGFNSTSFRFFNVCGADLTNGTGQASNQPHIITSMCRAAASSKKFKINGHDLKTKDGTCIRDYIHVNDVCSAIINELSMNIFGVNQYNLCTGIPTSNLQLFNKFVEVTGISVSLEMVDSREGDPDYLVGDNEKYKRTGWKPKETLDSMIESAWEYYKKGL